MEALTGFLEQHGYWLLAGVGFAEFAGLPIASVPVLVGAGALASQAGLHPVAIAAAAAAGGVTADAAWYGLTRWRGGWVVGSACGLTSNPTACVLGVRSRVERVGPKYILAAKFVPGAANLIAPAAALGRVGLLRFLALDAVALLLWAGAYVALGRLFAGQVEAVIAILATYARWALVVGLSLVALAGAWRWARVRRHAGAHAEEESAASSRAGS